MIDKIYPMPKINIVNMTFLNENANIRQFGLLKFMNENSSDEHVISKISIVLRRDKIEAPYYMSTAVRLSSCLDMPEKGMFHAMDMLNFHRMHNLTEEKYNQIRTLIIDTEDNSLVKIKREEKRLKMEMTSKSDEEFEELLRNYHELFEMIDGLVG